MFKQTLAVTALNIKSIPHRLGLSLATVFSIALVVAVLMGFLAMANGFRATVSGSGSDSIAVLLRAGSQAELNSGLSRDDARLVEIAPGLATNAAGDPVLSGEMYVIVDGIKRSSQTEANLPLRGVGAQAPALRDGFTITEGRMFEPGAAELVVGESVQREFAGFDLGDTIRLGSNTWTVVGTFSTGGSIFDSEIWTDIGVLQNLYQRGTTVQSIRVLLESPEAIEALRAYVADEPRLNLDVSTEREYFASSSGQTSDFIMVLGWPLAISMAIGALAGAWNTMYSSVDTRTREIATLRAIGFSGGAAFAGTMIESVVLAAIGGLIGAVASYLLFNGVSASTLGGGFTQIVFSFAVTPQAVINGVILAIIVGFLGGLIPALRAARVPLLAVHTE
ncbi:ABC transporter permease [Hyphobacterium marinum]|uniref:ABC transporter permease n=1 Tax=Hyphobacterium marinum TaxID=3116574 RepID=A0ABU7LYM0_9PROT|nr:ABC transporter permease [Hyphobacterium sp. Y6023]MEE2566275.1 ABC transporter permease [Hyphobacterium sp. Y6023]